MGLLNGADHFVEIPCAPSHFRELGAEGVRAREGESPFGAVLDEGRGSFASGYENYLGIIVE